MREEVLAWSELFFDTKGVQIIIVLSPIQRAREILVDKILHPHHLFLVQLCYIILFT